MKICGLITEYNPFHNGHLHHLKRAKQITSSDYTIAVMSGHFLQRGEPALLDKWTRAEMAVRSGVDLVVELPTYFATSSAEKFAFGAVSLLDKMGVESICFGVESDDVGMLKKVATCIDSPSERFKQALRTSLDAGEGYHVARGKAVKAELGAFEFSANNILGVEYIRAINRLHSKIKVFTTPRVNNDYLQEDITSSIASATAIRKLFCKRPVDWTVLKSVVPEVTHKIMYDYPKYTHLNDFKTLFNAIAIREGASGLSRVRGVSEGLNNRIIDHLSNVMSLDDLVEAVVSKRYTKTRIQRILVSILLGIHKEYGVNEYEDLDYGRILAYRSESAPLLRYIKKECDIYMITNLARDLKKYRRENVLIDLDIKATGLYAQINHAINIKSDFKIRPIGI